MEVIIAPDPKLRVQTKPVKKVNQSLKDRLKEMVKLTKTFVDPEGVGLASTQIGENERYFVAKIDEKKFRSFINPKIVKTSKQTKVIMEGCLSIPNYWGEVKRHTWADVSYMDENGEVKEERVKGLLAIIFQHECDHLDGKLFMDHVHSQKGKLYKVTGRDRTGAEIYQEVPL
jgi:peptide deformylase